jgi:hypothetical protein
VLAYHDKLPPLAYLILIPLMLHMTSRSRRAVRVPVAIFSGAVISQYAAWFLWRDSGGVPDYLHVFGVIANAADVVMLGSAAFIFLVVLRFGVGALSGRGSAHCRRSRTLYRIGRRQ